MRHGTRFSLLVLGALLSGMILPRPGAAQGWYVGGRMGGSFTTFGGDASEGLESHRPGVVVGGIVGRRIHDLVALQTDPSWIQKGAKGTLLGFEEPIAVDLRLEYLDVPLLVRVAIPTPRGTRPTVSGGGAVSFETRCDVRTDPEELALTFGCDRTDTGERRRTTDWSLLAGAGVEFDAGFAWLPLDGRYHFGLVEVGTTAGLKNRGATVTLGVLLPVR